MHGWLYLGGTPQNGGPPFRTIVDSGIHVGAGSDAAAVSVFDPWLEIYYMVTGKNSAGEMINPGQQFPGPPSGYFWRRTHFGHALTALGL